MVEFSDREKTIIHAMLTLINPQLEKTPLDVRKLVIMATLKARGMNFDEQELTDIVLGITDERDMIQKNALGLLSKHGVSIKELGNFKL
jgi:hypothetical protein